MGAGGPGRALGDTRPPGDTREPPPAAVSRSGGTGAMLGLGDVARGQSPAGGRVGHGEVPRGWGAPSRPPPRPGLRGGLRGELRPRERGAVAVEHPSGTWLPALVSEELSFR